MNTFRKTIQTLFGLTIIDQTYLTLTAPLLTLIFFDPTSRLFTPDTPLATRSLWFGVCAAMPNLINMFVAPVLSMLSDEFGRRKIFSIEIFSAFLSTFCVGWGVYFGQLPLIFLGFFIRGVYSRVNPTALAIISDITPQGKKLTFMGYYQLAISVGATIGPILGGFIASRYFFSTLNFSFAFFFAAGLALLNTLFSLLFLPETFRKSSVSRSFSWQNFKNVLTNKRVLKISAVLFLIQFSWSTYYQYMPPILKTVFAYNGHRLGLFIGMIALWLALASSVGVKLLDQYFEIRTILFIAMTSVLVGLSIAILASTHILGTTWLWVGAIPVASGDVIAYSCLVTLFSDSVSPQDQGKVMGIIFIYIALAWSFTGLTGGYLMSLNSILPLIIAPIGILSAIFYAKHKLPSPSRAE